MKIKTRKHQRLIKMRSIVNPRLFRDELELLINKNVWFFVYGKSLRVRLHLKLSNKKSTLFDSDKQPLEDLGYVALGNNGENEIFFTTSLIEKIEVNPNDGESIIYLKVKTFGFYD